MKRGVKKEPELPNPEPQQFFRIEDLADRWLVSKSTIRRMIDRGELFVTRFGGTVRISLSEIQKHEAGGE